MSIGFFILVLSLLPALGKRSASFCLMWILGSGILAYEYAEVLYSWSTRDYVLMMPDPIGAVNIALNKLSAFFGVIFALGLPIGIMYGHFYLKAHHSIGIRSHLFWMGILGLSMHSILWVRHSIVFLMLWELMSLASFFCVIQDRKDSLKAGISYLIMMQVGAAFLIAGFALSYIITGTFDFSAFAHMGRLPLFLILIGFAFKAGFFPIGSWLPIAHPVAPSHISGIMSGLMIKAGLYGIVLMLSCNLFSLLEIGIFASISLITAFWGVIHAMAEQNLKKALAYSSIENMGIIGIGLSTGLLGINTGNDAMAVLGFTGALLHSFFHSLFKAMLFYLSGNVFCAAHTLNIDELGGLSKRMPITAAMFLLGTIAISALPLGNGFISEFAIYTAMINGLATGYLPSVIIGIVLLSGMAFIGALALIAFTKLYSIVFQGNPRSENAINACEAKKGMLFPPLVLSSAIILTGLLGKISLRFVKPLIRWMGFEVQILNKLAEVYVQISIVFGILILIFTSLYLLRRFVVKEKKAPTWGCGYQKPSSKLQYSSIAYIQPLAYFLKPFILIRKQHKPSNGHFPTELCYHEEVRDAIWDIVILPICKLLSRLLNLFSRIHNGKTNVYIAYGLLFLIFLIIWIVGIR